MRFVVTLSMCLLALMLWAQDSTEATIDRGYERYLESDYEGAIAEFTRVLEQDSTLAEVYYLRGVCRSSLGEKQAAMEDLDAATGLRPGYAEAYYEKGYLYLTDQNPLRAIGEFDRAIALNPAFPEAYVSRGTARCMINNKSGAEQDWARAKELGVNYGAYMQCE